MNSAIAGPMNSNDANIKNEILNSIKALSQLMENPKLIALLSEQERIELMKVAGTISRPDRKERKTRNKETEKLERMKVKLQDREVRKTTGIRQARQTAIFVAPLKNEKAHEFEAPPLSTPRPCYTCNKKYTQVHHFYDALCVPCGDLNYAKRFQEYDLTGQVAVVTGARVKIGFHVCLILLRSGAEVVATTRFPNDAALRFSREPDYEKWRHRLHVFGLDLRHSPSVELFTQFVENNFKRLDILINNAAQTVRRPPGFYQHLLEFESKQVHELPEPLAQTLKSYEGCRQIINNHPTLLASEANRALPTTWQTQTMGMGLREPARLSQIPYQINELEKSEELFPTGKLDADLQQVDLRETNSWRLKLGEVSTPEMIEVQLVNSIAPFILCSKLRPMMKKDYTGAKHIINVTAMEGKFLKYQKPDRHPHTNMAKAALNMMTHTSASDYATDGIFMNAVDTGWVTDEDPAQITAAKQENHDFQPPLDIVDGAARILDPLLSGLITGKHSYGLFLKDYMPIDW
jgi:NAD(P)-dependent dehydrogenase (short-subunit alcohol dehydrogenase family)